MELPDPVERAVGLHEVLAGVVDPRQRRGVHRGLVVVLTVAVCAVVAGARSFAAVVEWVADLPDDVAAVLGDRPALPVGLDDPPVARERSTPTGSTR